MHLRALPVASMLKCLFIAGLWLFTWPATPAAGEAPDRYELRTALLQSPGGEREVVLPDAWNKAGRSGRKLYRLVFDLPAAPAEAWALYVPRAGNRFHIRLNGWPIARAGPLGDRSADHAQKPHLFSLPDGALRAGGNQLEVLVEGDTNRYAGLSRVHVGADRLLRRDFLLRNAAQHGGSLAVVAMCGVFGMLALALFMGLRQPSDAFFALACLFCCIRTSYAIVERVPFDYRWWTWLVDVSYAGLVVCITLFCVRALRMAARRWDLVAAGFSLFSLILVTWHAAASRNDVRQVWLMAMLAYVMLMSTVFVFQWWRQRTATSAVLAGAALGGVAMGAHDHWLVFYARDGYGGFAMARFALVLFILAMGWIIVDRLIERMREERRLRAAVALELEEKKQELARQYERQAAAEAAAVRHQERRRLIQDLHDGMGLQLNSLLGMVEKGSVDPAEVQNEVRHSIEQLRTLVDGSEAFDGSLPELLGHIRHRIDSRLRRLQIALDWRSELTAGPRQVDAAAAVNLQHVLFELCTNAIKHSAASRVTVRMRLIDEPGRGRCLEIGFEDNGNRGVQAANGSGLGQRSVERRVEELGGSHELVRAQGQGWRYRFVLPLARLEGTVADATD